MAFLKTRSLLEVKIIYALAIHPEIFWTTPEVGTRVFLSAVGGNGDRNRSDHSAGWSN